MNPLLPMIGMLASWALIAMLWLDNRKLRRAIDEARANIAVVVAETRRAQALIARLQGQRDLPENDEGDQAVRPDPPREQVVLPRVVRNVGRYYTPRNRVRPPADE